MQVRFQTFEQYHNRQNVGSSKIRVHNLLKHWPEAGLYKYGEKPDVLIFQKVYCTQDYKFPATYKGGIKILDICDPDWLDGVFIKETVDGMDAVTCPTEPIAEFIRQLTDKPVKVVKDRFDLNEFKQPKTHTGKAKSVVWFGYSHNSDVLKNSRAIPVLERLGLKLTVISDQDPSAWRWASPDYKKHYVYKKYGENAYKQIQEHDMCILPQGFRPVDKYKSENKTIIAQLLGLPVVKTLEDLERFGSASERNKEAQAKYHEATKNYDVRLSVDEYKELIKEISNAN